VTTNASSRAVTLVPASVKGLSLVGNAGDSEKSTGNSGKAKAASKKRRRGTPPAEPVNSWGDYV
jgi:hypothetical protein